jgi:hypothetical protein
MVNGTEVHSEMFVFLHQTACGHIFKATSVGTTNLTISYIYEGEPVNRAQMEVKQL